MYLQITYFISILRKFLKQVLNFVKFILQALNTIANVILFVYYFSLLSQIFEIGHLHSTFSINPTSHIILAYISRPHIILDCIQIPSFRPFSYIILWSFYYFRFLYPHDMYKSYRSIFSHFVHYRSHTYAISYVLISYRYLIFSRHSVHLHMHSYLRYILSLFYLFFILYIHYFISIYFFPFFKLPLKYK